MAMKVFPRPMGGPEPSPLGDTREVPNSNAPLKPGYDYANSVDGASASDLKRGYRGRTRITDAGSDAADWIHPPGQTGIR